MKEDLSADLLATLGEDDFIRLVEVHGGLHLYIPTDLSRSELPTAIGMDAAARLSKKYSPSYIRVPVAKEVRAVRYHIDGATNREIARRLGITENSVNRLLKRARTKDPKKVRPKKDTGQIDMFEA